MEVPIWTFGSAVDAARAEAAAFAAARAEGGAGGLGGGLGGFDIEDGLAARDELPDDVRRAAGQETGIGGLSFLYETSEQEDLSYKSWPPVFMTRCSGRTTSASS